MQVAALCHEPRSRAQNRSIVWVANSPIVLRSNSTVRGKERFPVGRMATPGFGAIFSQRSLGLVVANHAATRRSIPISPSVFTSLSRDLSGLLTERQRRPILFSRRTRSIPRSSKVPAIALGYFSLRIEDDPRTQSTTRPGRLSGVQLRWVRARERPEGKRGHSRKRPGAPERPYGIFCRDLGIVRYRTISRDSIG